MFRTHHEPRGQVIVIAALAIVALIAMTGLIVDGGAAFASQRATQNAADSAADAGALTLAERLGGASAPASGWDAEVAERVDAAAVANNMPDYLAVYTSIDGTLLGSGGGAVGSPESAAEVGKGTIPAGTAGVAVYGTLVSPTYFVRVLGVNGIPTSADATAVAGILTGAPKGALLPITFPVMISSCDKTADLVPGTAPWPLVGVAEANDLNMAIVPLCTTGPGSIGWLDLGDGNLADQIDNPTNRAFDVPTWLQTQTGTVDAMQEPMEQYIGQVVLIPMFDGTCVDEPTGSALGDCLGGEGVGDNTWYHIPKFAGFLVHDVFFKNADGDNPKVACNEEPGAPFVNTTNGSVACMKGWFVRYITVGPVTSGTLGDVDPGAIGVQLIK
jgi:hypothetical protein